MPGILLLLSLLLTIILPVLAVKPTALHMLVVAIDHMQSLKFMFRECFFFFPFFSFSKQAFSV